MFLHQKFGYEAKFVTSENFHLVETAFNAVSPEIVGFDTETDSLNFMRAYPFLVTFGFDKYVFAFEPSMELLGRMYKLCARAKLTFAHNVQYDFHVTTNFGCPVPEDVALADSMAVARLTQFADDLAKLSLEALGIAHVDESAKSAGKVIKTRISELNRLSKAHLKKFFINKYPKLSFPIYFEKLKKRVQFVKTEDDAILDEMSCYYSEANYNTVYIAYPELMINYAMDDVVIMLEFLKKAMPVLDVTDPGHTSFKIEKDLIRPVCQMEREGILADVDYLLESRKRMVDYREIQYQSLYELLGAKISVGQHAVLITKFRSLWGIELASADESSLEDVFKLKCPESAKQAAELIIELRTLDKWISTYIDGKLNSITNGRFYTSINNSGTVSGRVSCNLQQQPKEAFFAKDGTELLHPRKAFIADPGTKLFFIDFSQMELRWQAYYTLFTGEGDMNMCRAYIPFKCHSAVTGEPYDINNRDHMKRWDSGEWLLDENNETWEAIDIHCVTTHVAFPGEPYVSLAHNDLNPPGFKKLRKLGKTCNFLKNYQGGIKAIMGQMKLDEITAQRLDRAYYDSFPGIKTYQYWVNDQLIKYGYVENLYKRRYYMQNAQWFYKAGNYVIQGGCAILVKLKEIEITNYLNKMRSMIRFILPIHDELVFRVPNGEEEKLVPNIQAIMQDVNADLKWIPMISEIEVTSTNWADKKPWEGLKE